MVDGVLEGEYQTWIDVNGDGLPDWVGWISDAEIKSNLQLKLNQGNGTFAAAVDLGVSVPTRKVPVPGLIPNEPDYRRLPKFGDAFKVMDIDGDGRVELIMPSNEASDMLVEGCKRFGG